MTNYEIEKILKENSEYRITTRFHLMKKGRDSAISYLQEKLNCSKEVAEYGVNYVENEPKSSDTSVRCPYCKSTNVKKIGVVSRSMSVGMFGLGSGKIGKQWHCNGCKSDF